MIAMKHLATSEHPPALLLASLGWGEGWSILGRSARVQKRPMGLEIEAPTPDKYEKGAGRLEGGTA